jgi:hypothetical protein
MPVSAKNPIHALNLSGFNRSRHQADVRELGSAILFRQAIRQIGVYQQTATLKAHGKAGLTEPGQAHASSRQGVLPKPQHPNLVFVSGHLFGFRSFSPLSCSWPGRVKFFH